MKKNFLFCLFFLFLGAGIGEAAERIEVVTTIRPLEFFISRIGADKVSVSVMIPPGGNPHTYEPLPSQLSALARTGLYVKVGSGIEFELVWLDKLRAVNKKMRICDASKGIELIAMGPEEEHGSEDDLEDDHGHGHDHGAKDPHIWWSVDNAVKIAGNIRDSLIEADPENKEMYSANASVLVTELDGLKKEIQEELSKVKKRTFLSFHPSWGYFALDFGLEQRAVELSGKEPTPRQMNELIKLARADGIKVVFASPQFSVKSAGVIAREIKGEVVMIDSLSGDYMENLKKLAGAIAESAK